MPDLTLNVEHGYAVTAITVNSESLCLQNSRNPDRFFHWLCRYDFEH